MKKMKRILWITLACLMAGVSTIGASSCDFGDSSEDSTTAQPNSEGLEYTLNADGASYSVVGIGTCTDTDVVIPATYEGLPVTSIGDSALDYCLDLTSVVIPDSVTSIGACAFEYSYGLRSIVIGDGVTSIGEKAFSRCFGLTELEIGENVTWIGEDAFFWCYRLVEIYNKSSITIREWNNSTNENPGYSPKNIYTPKEGESKLSTDENGYVIYTDGADKILINYIGKETDLILPKGITEINQYALYDCKSLKSVEIPDSVISIGAHAFDHCQDLISVVIGEKVISMGAGVFAYCYKLVEIYNKSSLSISNKGSADFYFEYENIYTPTEGESKLSTDKNGYVIYTEGANKILIDYKGAETKLVLPEGITEINQHAFYDCDSLTSVEIPDSVIKIGDDAFSNCVRLTSVAIGNNVALIGQSAFFNCYRLVEIYNKSSLPINMGGSSQGSIGFYAKNIYTPTEGESKLSTDENGYVIYTDGEDKILVSYEGKETDLVLPKGLTTINRYAFYECHNLKSVKISDGIAMIDFWAFYHCQGLTSVSIPDSVIEIGGEAFYVCQRLKAVEIGSGVSRVWKNAFQGCSKIKNVYYKGGAGEWEAMTIDLGNAYISNATRYYYSETEPTEEGNYWHYDKNGEIVVW